MNRRDSKSYCTKLYSAVLNDKLFYLLIIPMIFAWLLVNVHILTQDDYVFGDGSQISSHQETLRKISEEPLPESLFPSQSD